MVQWHAKSLRPSEPRTQFDHAAVHGIREPTASIGAHEGFCDPTRHHDQHVAIAGQNPLATTRSVALSGRATECQGAPDRSDRPVRIPTRFLHQTFPVRMAPRGGYRSPPRRFATRVRGW